jgi:hypothetical protein
VEWRGQGGVKVSGSVFYNVFEDMITKDYNVASPSYLQYLNTGNLESVGFDFGAEKVWANGRELKLNFNHNEYIVHEGTNWGAVDAPKNIAKKRPKPPFDLTGTWFIDLRKSFADFRFGPPYPEFYEPGQTALKEAAAARAAGKPYRDSIGEGTINAISPRRPRQPSRVRVANSRALRPMHKSGLLGKRASMISSVCEL